MTTMKDNLTKHHPERMNRLLAAFRAGKEGRPLQCRRGEVTICLQNAYRSGVALRYKNNKEAMGYWQSARFFQGKKTPPFTNFHVFISTVGV